MLGDPMATMELSLHIFILIIALTRWTLAASFGPFGTCDLPEMVNFNASGAVDFAGFRPLGSINSTWTLSTAIKNTINSTGDHSYAEQAFWIDTHPVVNLSTTNLPYQGCAIAVNGGRLARTGVSRNPTGENSCDMVMSQDCQKAVDELVKTATDEALQSRQIDASASICKSLVLAPYEPPDACPGDLWDTVYVSNAFGSTDFFRASQYSALANDTVDCPTDVGSGTSSTGLLASMSNPFGLTRSRFREGCAANDMSCYNAAVDSTWLFLFTAFARNATSLPLHTDEYPDGYMETRMLCVSPNQYFSPGSKVVSRAPALLKGSIIALLTALVVSVAGVMS